MGKRGLITAPTSKKIEERYKTAKKDVRVCEIYACKRCRLNNSVLCSAARYNDTKEILTIRNNDQTYRLCKAELYEENLNVYHQQREERKRERAERRITRLQFHERELPNTHEVPSGQTTLAYKAPSERSCYTCERRLDYVICEEGYIRCGSYQSAEVNQDVRPEHGKTCRFWKQKDL